MSVRSTLASSFIVFAALLAGLLFFSSLVVRNQTELGASEVRRYQSYKLADELRQTSDDLTRLARLYVATGDPAMEAYFHEVIRIRNGEVPRPDDYDGIYWDFVLATGKRSGGAGDPVALETMMRRMNFTEEELLRLEQSKARSDALVLMEEQAMNAVKGIFNDAAGEPTVKGEPDLEMARRIMFGPEYHQAKAEIMEPLREFMIMQDERTARETVTLRRRGRIYGTTVLGLAVAALLFTFVSFVVLYRRIMVPVRKLGAAADRVKAGDYARRVEHPSADELGQLASSFNHMASAIEEDIEERKRQEELIRLAREQAEAANHAKSSFLSHMSHELRTPLNGVLGYAQILQRDPEVTATQSENLGAIVNCGDHLLALINDVLDLSKIEAGQIEVDLRPSDLHELIDSVVDVVRQRAADKGVSFEVEISSEVPRGVRTDAAKLRQILVNLLGNAVKFTSEGGVVLHVAESPRGSLRFDVRDSGVGMEEEELAEIFDPFKQVEAGKAAGGTGLGLAITQRLVESLDGEIGVESRKGEGSTFSVTLPLEEVEAEALGQSEMKPAREVWPGVLAPGQAVDVLVADDRETNRDILIKMLGEAGFGVRAVDDGDRALEALREAKADIVLMDVRMPRMNGIEALKEIRADRGLKDLKVIAVTASVFPAFQQKALEEGFDDFLGKPFRTEELMEKLRHHLDLEFVDASGDAAPAGGGKEAALDWAGVPAELRDELIAALKIKNLTAINGVAGRLKEQPATTALGEEVAKRARAFDFTGLEELVNDQDTRNDG